MSLCVFKRINVCLCVPSLGLHAPLVLLCRFGAWRCPSRLPLSALLGVVMPSSVSFALVLLSCLGLLCSCAAALSGAPLFPLFLALFFFVGVLAWVVLSSL
jgi:hypothetical protein